MSAGAYPELHCGRKLGRVMTTQAGLVGFYNYPLVALSIFIAILSAYAALDLAGRVTTAQGGMRLVWLCGGAIAMGSGIWAMHYVGMEAFRLPVPVLYDWPTVLLSLLAAILASGVALYIVSRPTMGLYRRIVGSIVMGSGIAAMHYIGMAAMRLPAMCADSTSLVVLSIALAIVISYVALRLSFALREEQTLLGWRKINAALAMGMAIPVMHYVGMTAVTFVPTIGINGSLRHAISVSNLSLSGIVMVTFVLLAIVFVSSSVDRRLSAQARQSADNFAQLQAVFDTMTDAIVVVDFEKNTVEHNRAAAALLSLTKKITSLQDITENYEGLLPTGELLAPEQWPIMRAAHGDYCSNFELIIRKKATGATATTEVTSVPMTSSRKRGAKVIFSFRDVGERMLAEELIRRQKSQLQNIFDNLNEGVMLMDMDLNIVQINRAASRLLGIPNAAVSRDIIKTIFEVMSPNGDQLPRDQWPSGLAYNGVFIENREFRVRRTDTANSILAQISTAPVLDSSGDMMQIIVSYRDITRTKEADEERRRLAAIVEFSEDAIIGKNYDGIVTSWNRGAGKIFGYTAAEMIGQPIQRLLPPDRVGEETDILRRLRQGEVVDHFETVRVRKDGHHINVSLTISPIRNDDGNVIGASKIARDITDRMKLEHQLQQSQKMDAVGQLTGGIAHDFNNLLGIVIGNLDLLERQVSDDETALKRVQAALKASLRGADLTRRLLAFSSSEILAPEPTKLRHLICNIIEMASRVIGPEIKVTTSFDESITQILIDPAGLESALLNLMVNARDAMPKGGSISISTQLTKLDPSFPPVHTGELQAGTYACISVSDTGQGISKQALEHVFEPFFTTKPRGKGTGLGLAMVYGFVKQSHGTVRIYSEPGYGTTVTLYLPFTEGALLPVAEIVEDKISFNGSAAVLVVDDEVDLLDIATAYLEGMGCKAFTAIDGNDALKVVAREKDIDLMVTDIIMPGGINGVELAQKVRQLNPKIKVIYCSGFPADSLAERSMPLVDGPLLHKPYQREAFSALVRRMMKSRNAETKI